MYPRTEYEMSEADLEAIMNAIAPVPYIMVGGYAPRSQQERANSAWDALGQKMGFAHMTVRPIEGKGKRFFTAIPSETETARDERLAKEAEEKRQGEIARLTAEIAEREQQLAALTNKAAE
jgi:nitrogen regulatory protein PII